MSHGLYGILQWARSLLAEQTIRDDDLGVVAGIIAALIIIILILVIFLLIEILV